MFSDNHEQRINTVQELYAHADQFDGYRFSEKREAEGEGTKHQMVALGHDFLTFGTGRHAWYAEIVPNIGPS